MQIRFFTLALVVLSAAVIPSEGSVEIARKFKVAMNPDGFFQEAHVKLRPVDFAAAKLLDRVGEIVGRPDVGHDRGQFCIHQSHRLNPLPPPETSSTNAGGSVTLTFTVATGSVVG